MAALESHIDELQENLDSAEDDFKPHWEQILQDSLGAYDVLRAQLKRIDKKP